MAIFCTKTAMIFANFSAYTYKFIIKYAYDKKLMQNSFLNLMKNHNKISRKFSQ